MSVSNARALLRAAGTEQTRVKRHLLVAAALREVLTHEPVVVGGSAQDYYTDSFYRQTDLDVCVAVTRQDRETLGALGFVREGRHWFHAASQVAVEFPDDHIDGDDSRTVLEQFDGGAARIIGLDDLYLDRVRQATMTSLNTDISFRGALAIASARFEQMDWPYIRQRINEISVDETSTGPAMASINRRVRRRARLIATSRE